MASTGFINPNTTPGITSTNTPTWQDISNAALTYSGKPGSSTPAFSPLTPVSNQTTTPLQPLQPPSIKQPSIQQPNDKNNDTNLNNILRILGLMFGLGA